MRQTALLLRNIEQLPQKEKLKTILSILGIFSEAVVKLELVDVLQLGDLHGDLEDLFLEDVLGDCW